jgi:hypothetical protein
MSALVWLESTVHRALDLYMGTVATFVVPSRFFLAKFTEWGIAESPPAISYPSLISPMSMCRAPHRNPGMRLSISFTSGSVGLSRKFSIGCRGCWT